MSGQRGSALAFVLIAVAILAILGAVILAEISTHIKASQKATQRVAYEATLNSAIEYGIRGLQDSSPPGTYGCDADRTWTTQLNTLSSNVTYKCQALNPATSFGTLLTKLDRGDAKTGPIPPNASLPPPSAFNYAGTELHGTGCSRTDYVLPDLTGILYDYPWGTSSATTASGGWTFNLGSPPAFTPIASCATGLAAAGSVFIPINQTKACSGNTTSCLVRIDEPLVAGAPPTQSNCQSKNLPSNNKMALISAQPSMGVVSPTNVYLGFNIASDGNDGNLVAIDLNCNQLSSNKGATTPPQGTGPVIAGPYVAQVTSPPPNTGDDLYVVENIPTGTNQGAYMVHYECANNGSGNACNGKSNGLRFTFITGSPKLFGPDQAVGMSVMNNPVTTSQLPARAIVTGATGQVTVININADGTLTGEKQLASALTGTLSPPSWCPAPVCDQTNDIVGVGSTDGNFFRLNAGTFASPALALASTTPIPGKPAIHTRPALDKYADWYMGADDGNLWVLQPSTAFRAIAPPAPTTPASPILSSPVVDNCGTSICIYVATGTTDDSAYLLKGTVTSTGRVAYLYACTPPGAPDCNSSNFKAWAQVQVTNGSATVQSWSYSNPSP
jgi:type II secretory pathway pseudopilin PulG